MKTSNSTFCCGSYNKKIKIVKAKLPPNPKVEKGIAVIYLGSGVEIFIGKSSGLKYYVSDHERHFKVAPEDIAALLNNNEIILRP